MKNQISDESPKHKVEFPADCKVRITKGSFAEFYGTVKSVDYEKNKAKVLLVVFNRETEVDLEIDSLEIIFSFCVKIMQEFRRKDEQSNHYTYIY
jgi:transcription antitermination factor NusG